jgi:predicted enzyme related to lactoylglutathione lyase
MVQVRYIVTDIKAAIDFYTRQLGFHLDMYPAPASAMLSRSDLRLVLSMPNPQGGGGQPMPDGQQQQPGGWNRFAIQVSDLDSMAEELRKCDAHFRNDIVSGAGASRSSWKTRLGTPSSCSSLSSKKPAYQTNRNKNLTISLMASLTNLGWDDYPCACSQSFSG